MPASGPFKGHSVTEKVNSYDLNTDRLVIIESVIFHVQLLDMELANDSKVECVMGMANGCHLELPFPLRKYKATIRRAAGTVN